MSRTTAFLKDIASSLVKSLLRAPAAPRSPAKAAPKARTRVASTTRTTTAPEAPTRPARPTSNPSRPAPTDASTRGQYGPSATVEVDPRSVGAVRMTYSPSTDGAPDPGEIVWTWVPFEENDGRGKDRPVVVVATEVGGTVLAVQLTSKAHDRDVEFLPLGSGPWDAEGRPSWVNLERVLRVHKEGMRREAAALDEQRYQKVEAALKARYRWS